MSRDQNAIPEDWFDYELWYRDIAEWIPPGGIFVEVGVWQGVSLRFMGEVLREYNKDVHIIGVDSFEGSVSEPIQQELVTKFGGPDRLYSKALTNLAAAGIRNVSLYRMDSVVAAGLFQDGTIDAVYLDADHEFNSVINDIKAWLPKIKPNGIISGHDADAVSVRKALKYIWGEDYEINQTVWYRRVY